MSLSRRQLLAGAAGAATGRPAASASRPNILFLFTDDHHYQCFGAAGNPHIRTPRLDRLAERGVHFTNAVVSTSQCAPSRGICISGRETFQTGLRSNGATRFSADFGPTAIDQLARAGYETSIIGKWHIANKPAEVGFAHAPLWLEGGASKYIDPVLRRGNQPARTVEGHITRMFTDEAIRTIGQPRQQPYFLWLAYNAPHSPLYADEKFTRMYRNAAPPPRHDPKAKPFHWDRYYAAITQMDEEIGRVLDAVDWSNTVVFFCGDNGFMCGARGLSGKVVPWEESVRVPCAVAGAGVRKGVRTDAPIASIDFPATWLDLAGVKPARSLPGRTLKPLLTTGKGAPDEAFVVWDDARAEALAVREAVEPFRQVRTSRYKLTVWESKKQALFDHVDDISEERNLINDAESARVGQDLRTRLERRMRHTADHAISWLN